MDSRPPKTLTKPYKYPPKDQENEWKKERRKEKKKKIRKMREISIRNTMVEV
jgi:hypothetical protein